AVPRRPAGGQRPPRAWCGIRRATHAGTAVDGPLTPLHATGRATGCGGREASVNVPSVRGPGGGRVGGRPYPGRMPGPSPASTPLVRAARSDPPRHAVVVRGPSRGLPAVVRVLVVLLLLGSALPLAASAAGAAGRA